MNSSQAVYLPATKLFRHAIMADIPFLEANAIKALVKDRWSFSGPSGGSFFIKSDGASLRRVGMDLILSAERTRAKFLASIGGKKSPTLPQPKDGKRLSARNARRLSRR